MDIMDIWMSQTNLRRSKQIQGMIETIRNGGLLSPITLARCEDGEIQVEDGHHRLMAIYLSGRSELFSDEFVLIEKDQWKNRFGKVDNLRRCRSMVGHILGTNKI